MIGLLNGIGCGRSGTEKILPPFCALCLPKAAGRNSAKRRNRKEPSRIGTSDKVAICHILPTISVAMTCKCLASASRQDNELRANQP